MDIADFARQLLFDPDLQQKLQPPGTLTDERRGLGLEVPAAPARCQALEFKARGSSPAPAFPSLRDLEQPSCRAMVLHFFANHELLAMELMALALLRFPDAPPKFRRGLVAVIQEEQQHLRLYKRRMEDLGMGFGAVPVSRFFWDVMADTPSPLTFITQMALTLEQANLDYSLHFLQLFRQLEDTATAAILSVVYQEETSHVAHGVAWFNAWRPADGTSDWAAYKKLLPASLTPARAKGLGFHPEARRAAGLSEEFIQELQVYSHSKGRPPNVYWFNPGCEIEVAAALCGHAVGEGSKAVRQIQGDLAGLMAFIATPQDVVMVAQPPTTGFLAALTTLGFMPPQFVTAAQELQGRLLGRFAPWGQSAAAIHYGHSLGLNWQTPLGQAANAGLFAKSWAKALSIEAGFEPLHAGLGGTVCHDITSAQAEVAARLIHGTVVIKAAYGTAGRHMQRVYADVGLTALQCQWMAGVLARQGAVVIEPWRQRVVDLSVQINVANGLQPILGITRFLTDERGQYGGHVLGRKLNGLDPTLLRTYHEQDFPGRLLQVAATVNTRLAAAGYVGPAGIDALVYKTDEGYHLYPLVEINPRFTMGRIALELDRRVHAAARCHWLHISVEQIRRSGWADAAAYALALQQAYPVTLRRGLLESGVVPTNDPTAAKAILTLLVAGDAALTALAKNPC